jgi:HNH endonuclease
MSECWLWPRVNNHGYGRVDWFGKPRYTHRVIAAMTYGAAAIHDMDVMHLCDSKACWRPDHLRPATTQENMIDYWTKKKAAAARSRAAAYQGVTYG